MMLRLVALCALLAVAGCSSPKLVDTVCLPFAEAGSVESGAASATRNAGAFGASGAGPDVDLGLAIGQTLARVNPRGVRIADRRPLHILAISIGGQNGAFSSGFLTGWTEAGTRPEFVIVTGASAGALVAPVAYLGSAYDTFLRRNTGISDGDVFRKRAVFEVLGSNSLFDTKPLNMRLRDLYDDDAVFDALSVQTAGNRLLLVGATDLNSGQFKRFDFARLMQSDLPRADKVSCLTEATLASSAIPGLFPPRRINGALHADAGVRQSIFLTSLAQALDAQGAGGRPVIVSLLINSDLAFEPTALDDGFLPVIARNVEIVTDEGMRNSIAQVIDRARFNGWSLRAAMIEDMPQCDSSGDKAEGLTGGETFSPCVTEALFEQGRDMAKRRDPWMTAKELRQVLKTGR